MRLLPLFAATVCDYILAEFGKLGVPQAQIDKERLVGRAGFVMEDGQVLRGPTQP